MKKYFIFLLLLAVATYAIADDALVLPKGVIRTYITGAYAFASEEYDQDGEKGAFGAVLADKVTALNLGTALEYGVTDWISAAVQWAPGWTVWSATDGGLGPYADLLLNGPYNVFAGAKVQIIGPKAPVANEMIRLAAATGVKIPVKTGDASYWQEQYLAGPDGGGEEWVASYNDKPVWGIGARGYFDYVLNKMIYFNLYSEFIYYLGTVKRNEVSVADWGAVFAFPALQSDVSFGYDLTVEAEPHFEYMIADGMRLGAGLPVTFSYSPEVKYDDVAQADTDSYVLSIAPNVSLFLMKFFLPLEFKVGYTLPLMGKNSFATNTVVVQVKAYMKF